MDKTALILILVTNLMLVMILGIMAFLVYRYLKQKDIKGKLSMEAQEPQYHPGILERMQDLKKFKPKRVDLFCPIHPEEPGEVNCAICDKLYCRSCIRPFKTLHFCKEHIPLLLKGEWEDVLTVKTSTENPDEGVRLYEAKKHLFQNKHLPTYIETHYKINVDGDFIETYLVVFSLKENVERVSEELNDLK
jgi:hypothetical protein